MAAHSTHSMAVLRRTKNIVSSCLLSYWFQFLTRVKDQKLLRFGAAEIAHPNTVIAWHDGSLCGSK